jgi:hypothetical protein
MLNVRLSALALAGLSVVCASRAVTIVEDFSTNPLQDGWQVFGNTNLFQWDSTNHWLAVTWDSTQPNSYFYYPMGAQLTRQDDLSVEFDLRLSDIASGVEPGKTGPLQIGIGFLDSATVTSANFLRSAWGGAPNVAEFDYYPSGYYEYGGYISDILPTMTPSFISGINGKHYAPANLDAYVHELPTNVTAHIRLAYSAASQTVVLTVTTNGVPVALLPGLVLNNATNSQFTEADDFRVDMFSISSYSSSGDDYNSVLAHGTVGNLVVKASFHVTGGFIAEGAWQAQCFTHTNWLYTLERTSDLKTWTPVSAAVRGTGGNLSLHDTHTLPASAFYRVRAD